MTNVFPSQVTSIHLELTDKCQAACPMCARNQYGGKDGDNVLNVEISFDQFKTWFTPIVLNQLSEIFVCGNLGDPIIASECFEIFEYVKTTNPSCRLHIYTNGSLRTPAWWDKLARVLNSGDQLVFAIDGFADTHDTYRRGTSWNKIIDNAKAFMSAGGIARADVLVFRHNEHQIDDLTKFLLELGFYTVNARTTERFYGLDNFPVQNKLGEHEYFLNPPITSKWAENNNINYVTLVDNTDYQKILNSTTVDPQCWRGQSIYINAQGYLYPCSWVGSVIDNSKNFLYRTKEESVVRGRFFESAREIVDDIGKIKLIDTDLFTVLSNSNWNENLPTHWTTKPKLMCVKSCGTNFKEVIS